MIKPDQRVRLQRIQRLRLAAAVIDSLRNERPDLVNNLTMSKKLSELADAYEASPVKPFYNCKECREGTCRIHTTAPLRMKDEARKPPRVAMSRRRPIPTKPIPIAQREHDDEAEHEEGLAYGHDVPDGSD